MGMGGMGVSWQLLYSKSGVRFAWFSLLGVRYGIFVPLGICCLVRLNVTNAAHPLIMDDGSARANYLLHSLAITYLGAYCR